MEPTPENEPPATSPALPPSAEAGTGPSGAVPAAGSPPPARQPAAPPARLNLPTRLSEQIPGLAEYRPATEPVSGRALHVSDRDRKETRKVRTLLAGAGLFVLMMLAAIILAGSHAQPSSDDRLEWNREEMAAIEKVLLRTQKEDYQQAMNTPENNSNASRAIRSIVINGLQSDLQRVNHYLDGTESESDAEKWSHRRREQIVLERALTWRDGYDRPFNSTAAGLKLTVMSLGANGHVDTLADSPRDDLLATVTMPSGEPMTVPMWDAVFKMPDMSKVAIFDPGDRKCMDALRAKDPDQLTPRERQQQTKLDIEDMIDESNSGPEVTQKLREFDLQRGIPQPGDWKRSAPLDKDHSVPSTPGAPVVLPDGRVISPEQKHDADRVYEHSAPLPAK